jgi:hypothetical protein
MQHAIARQAEAERERRAKIINAEGEYQAAAKLAQAGEVIGANPTTLQLRYLQTLREIGGSQNSTVVFPMPIDLVKPMLDAVRSGTPPAQEKELERGDSQELEGGDSQELERGGANELGGSEANELGGGETNGPDATPRPLERREPS